MSALLNVINKNAEVLQQIWLQFSIYFKVQENNLDLQKYRKVW